MDEERIYGLIIESKDEGPLIMESKPMTHEKAVAKMREFLSRSDVIRVAVFRMEPTCGNETLILGETK